MYEQSSIVLGKTVEVRREFVTANQDNSTIFNGTTVKLKGTDEEIINRYVELGEEFDSKTGIQQNDPITFVFRNNSNVTVPYNGYENIASMELIKEALESGSTDASGVCLLYYERDGHIWQHHYLCNWGPMYPPLSK